MSNTEETSGNEFSSEDDKNLIKNRLSQRAPAVPPPSPVPLMKR